MNVLQNTLDEMISCKEKYLEEKTIKDDLIIELGEKFNKIKRII